ncbi:hypothetical protein GCM10023188_27060 [Pontibacter saemangeumensis]|uniref:Aerotolerance regulator N-terminal domain-containing protein n=1 Tax=Pontibacter saemangeumensis TaxID=1084525 RepID=A0ABP8LUU2_9BACT
MLQNLPFYIALLLAAFVVLLLLWLAWRRPNRQRRAWRLLASAVAGVSLVLLVFPPATKQAVSPGTAILLAEGYNADTLRALLREFTAAPLLFSYHTPAAKAAPVPDLYTFRRQHPGLTKVHLLGYGLHQEELQALEGIAVEPHLSAAPAGMAALYWPENIFLGEPVEVTGTYISPGKSGAWLYLDAAGQARDSLEIPAGDTSAFTLRYTPRQEGRFIYTVTSKAAGGTDTLGRVPVQVRPGKQLGVLLLASSPLFEFRFLKNHLAGLRHRVAWRITISKGISQSEWLNMPRTSLDRLTPKLLQQFDLVVTEPQALQNLSAGERAALQRAVTADGLGVLTITNAPATNRSTAFFTSFQTKRVAPQDTRTTRASWEDNVTATATAAPYMLVNSAAVSVLVTEQNEQLLAGAKREGWGKVALSLVPQTFAWQLEGKEEIYASYWAHLLSEVAKQEVQETFWQLTLPQVPQPNWPVTLTYIDYSASGSALPSATVTSLADSALYIKMPLAQNPVQPTQYSGTFWPHRSGWYQVQAPGAPPYLFYVQDADDWDFTKIQARRQATLAYIAQTKASSEVAPVVYIEEPVPLIWFFVLFVLSSGFLWLEEKF